MEPTDAVVLGIPKRTRAWLYLATVPTAATLTTIAMAIDGVAQVVVQAVAGGLAMAASLVAGIAARR